MNVAMLYLTFLKFGLLCFGGGYMLVPFLAADLVGEPPRPLSPETFANLISIAQITPGPVGINTATYVGFLQQGVAGGIAATFGMITPSLILTLLAIRMLRRWEKSAAVRGFLAGMRPASWGFIWAAATIFAGYSIFSAPIPWLEPGKLLSGEVTISLAALAISAGAMALLRHTKLSFLWVLLLCAAAGALFCR